MFVFKYFTLRSIQVTKTYIEVKSEKENTEPHCTNNTRKLKCTLFKSRLLPSENGAYKYSVFRILVHATLQRSTHQLNNDEICILFNCLDSN